MGEGKMKFVVAEPWEEHLIPKPSPKYAEIAAACRERGMDIADDDCELIDDMSEEEKFIEEMPESGKRRLFARIDDLWGEALHEKNRRSIVN
jgi:hypothetical protein